MKKTTLFDHGVEAFQLARATAPECYPCPICLRGFPTPSGLTIDHFPPRSQGGKSVVLTCAECNNRAGHELEADIKPAESLYDFATSTMAEPVNGEVTIDGLTLNASILGSDGNITVAGIPELNDPDMTRAVTERLEKRSNEGTWQDMEIKLSFGRHRPKNALAAWLRSAYLAVFAAWGFSYILRSQLNAVREQIRDPESQALRVFGFTMQKPEFDEPHISLIKRPESLAGHLAVIMGRHVIYLPGYHSSDLYRELAREADTGLDAQMSGDKEVIWPKQPRYELDFALSRGD